MTENKYKLYYFDWTGLAEISRLMFAISDVAYEDVRIPVGDTFPNLPEEWKAKFNWGQIPVLEVDGKQIAQASALNRFLARRFNLVGENDYESAKCDEYIDAIKDYISEWQKYFFEKDQNKKEDIKKNILEVTTPKYFGKLDKIIEENGGSGLVSSGLTWADIYLCHFATYFEDFCMCKFVKDYPAIESLVERFYNRPQVKKWMETRPPTIKWNIEIMNEKLKSLGKWSG